MNNKILNNTKKMFMIISQIIYFIFSSAPPPWNKILNTRLLDGFLTWIIRGRRTTWIRWGALIVCRINLYFWGMLFWLFLTEAAELNLNVFKLTLTYFWGYQGNAGKPTYLAFTCDWRWLCSPSKLYVDGAKEYAWQKNDYYDCVKKKYV